MRIASTRVEVDAVDADAGLEVAGRLAAELGHDLNNHLSAVLNYSFLLGRIADRDPALKEHLEELQASAWRAADLTQALHLFASRHAARREPLDVNAVIVAAAPVLRRLLEGYGFETRLALRLPAVLGVRAELEQVLVGLALHARQAVPRGSTIVLTTQAIRQDGGAGVRLSCVRRPLGGERRDASRVMAKRPSPRWVLLRRALKRLGARLSHGPDATHVDLPAEG